MFERKNRISLLDRFLAIGSATLFFVLLGVFLFINLNSEDDRNVVEAHDAKEIATIAARAVSAQDIQKKKDEILKKERDKKQKEKDLQEAERKKLEDIKKKQKAEEERLKELQKKKQEEEKAISLANKKKEEEKKKRELEKKKAAEKKRKKEAAEKKRKKAEDARRAAEAKKLTDLESELAREIAARSTTTLLNRYADLMQKKLQSNFITPVGASKNSTAIVNIRLDKNGNVQSSRIVQGSGNYSYDQAVIAAVGKSSPLPMPRGEPEVIKQLSDINLKASF